MEHYIISIKNVDSSEHYVYQLYPETYCAAYQSAKVFCDNGVTFTNFLVKNLTTRNTITKIQVIMPDLDKMVTL